MLDLGAGEGYVGAVLQEAGARVTLADVVDFHRVDLPFVLVDGGALPFQDATFDLVVLAYVLHHTADARDVMAEALRVGRRVVILESIYSTPLERVTLEGLDRLANRLRSHGLMNAQEEHLHFRTHEQWATLLGEYGTLTHARSFGRWPHRQGLYVLDR